MRQYKVAYYMLYRNHENEKGKKRGRKKEIKEREVS